MTAVALVPGAGGAGWYWHRVVAELRTRGLDAFAVDLPAADEASGLQAYADVVVEAIGGRDDVVLAAHSLGGFTLPLVWPRVATRAVVFVNAMVPMPGETAGEWSEHVGSSEARVRAAELGGYPVQFDDRTYFFHDVPADLVRESAAHDGPETDAAFAEAVDFAWPDAPVRVVAARDDRVFPLDLQRRIARDRLRVEPVVVPGGHLAPLSHPIEVADAITGAG
ncbi:MAG: alpha/beta hydrolase [Brevundimonas sp.]